MECSLVQEFTVSEYGTAQEKSREEAESSKKCLYNTQPFPGYHSRKLLTSGNSSMSFLLKRSKREQSSQLVGSLVLAYAVSHYVVFHCYPHAVSVFIILNSTALTLVLSDLLTHSSTKSLLRAPCLQDLGCAGEQARPECLLL